MIRLRLCIRLVLAGLSFCALNNATVADDRAQPCKSQPTTPMLSHPPDIITTAEQNQAAIENLRAYGPHPAYADTLRTFGQLIGIWDMDIRLFDKTGETTYHQPGVWMFS